MSVFSALACTPGPGSQPVASEPVDLLEEQEQRVAEAVVRAREQVVTLEFTVDDGKTEAPARRVATGVVVRDDGRGRDVLSVRVAPPPSGMPVVARDAAGRRATARWLADDPETGLTLLRVDDDSTTPRRTALPLALPASPPRLGSQVLVIGNPFGLGLSVTRGSISGLDRRLDLGARPLGGLIQIDAPLHPGDNGALVANLRGEWLGLVRSGLAPPGPDPAHDLGFALPARDALWVAERLRTRGRVDRAYLGVRIALRLSNEGPGAVLDSVLDETPAARAGLKSGDRVVTLDGHPVSSPHDLTDRLDRTPADAETVVEYYRGTVRDRRIVRMAGRPEPDRARDAERDRPANPKAEERRALKEQVERLERRIAELERARAKEPAMPQQESPAESER